MASLMQELIATLQKEQEAYQELLPVVEQKTQAIIANNLRKVQDITEIEHSPDKQRRKNKNIYLQFLL